VSQAEADPAPFRVDGRRTDTRQKIHEVALEVFRERGYDRATMQEIAARLGVTRPALYYHYRSKDDMLASIHQALACSLDDIIEWARSRPRARTTRYEVLRRLDELMAGPWGKFTLFAQANEDAMRDLSAASEFSVRMDTVGDLLSPERTVEGEMKGRLALAALFMARARGRQLGGNRTERAAAAMRLARRLCA